MTQVLTHRTQSSLLPLSLPASQISVFDDRIYGKRLNFVHSKRSLFVKSYPVLLFSLFYLPLLIRHGLKYFRAERLFREKKEKKNVIHAFARAFFSGRKITAIFILLFFFMQKQWWARAGRFPDESSRAALLATFGEPSRAEPRAYELFYRMRYTKC